MQTSRHTAQIEDSDEVPSGQMVAAFKAGFEGATIVIDSHRGEWVVVFSRAEGPSPHPAEVKLIGRYESNADAVKAAYAESVSVWANEDLSPEEVL